MEGHTSVLYREVLDYLIPYSGGRYIDGTVGAGGHAAGILRASDPEGRLLALDRDPEAVEFARKKLDEFGDRVICIQSSFAELSEVAPYHGFEQVHGMLLDLGLSSRQLADARRGFSFLHDGPLDMRFDPTSGRTADQLVNDLDEWELAKILSRYGEVRQSHSIARAIVRERPIRTTRQLADLIARESGGGRRLGRIHPATLPFQALRIAVNEELTALETGLLSALALLQSGGRLAVISFHSLEDRIVKRFIREQSRDCLCPPEQPICNCDARATLRPITKKVVRPSAEEIAGNPRSRSARLRVAQKLAGDER